MWSETTAIWGIAGLATLGVIARPWNLPEYIWAVAGAVLLVACGLLPWRGAAAAAGKGLDVYFFLVGMMLLAEVARQEGLFDWLAVQAVRHSRGSASRLFAIVYAVASSPFFCRTTRPPSFSRRPCTPPPALRRSSLCPICLPARSSPMPRALFCPSPNPANLVVFGERMPTLLEWMRYFALPSVASIVATFILLRISQRGSLTGRVDDKGEKIDLTRNAATVAFGLAATAIVLLAASASGRDLGLPTFVCGSVVTVIVLLLGRTSPMRVLRDVSWSVLPLVAGLFTLVEGLNHTGILSTLAGLLKQAATSAPHETSWGAGIIMAIASNLINNLPMGLIAATTTQAAHSPHQVTAAILIGVDLGPNLSVTGSLATILWLVAL